MAVAATGAGEAMGLRYTHVVFDLDGTLVDTAADLTAAVNHTLACVRLPPLPAATVCGYVGEGARRLVQRALGAAHQQHLSRALEIFLGYYGEHLLVHSRPYPGVPEMLAALDARGARLSVLTNKPAAMSRTILAGLGMLSRFAAVLGGDSLPTRKPDPAGVALLLASGATARDRLLLVGDSPIDRQTAVAAGVAFCGVAWGFAPAALRAAGAERIIDAPAALLAVVGA